MDSEIRRFDNVSCMGSNHFRSLWKMADTPLHGTIIRAEPWPNPAKPKTAAYCTFTEAEWGQGTLVKLFPYES